LENLVRSAKDAIEVRTPAPEGRAATQLPMNPGNMLLVRLNEDGLRLFKPEDLYLELFQAWKRGFFYPYSDGTAQQTIRQKAIKELPAKGSGSLAPYVDIWSSPQYDGPLRHGDIQQRISGTKEILEGPTL
jgi:hypothetical protein